ncbi:MAG: TetR/AcrR family transcriptional regulator [Eggerthellaceae bacterium]|jgi:AcrR family transcriptional regulator
MVGKDPRYLQADARIRAAFLDLFRDKDIEDITTSEIIRAAGVNRSTFYAHYADKYALLDAVEQEFLDRLETLLPDSPAIAIMQGRECDRAALESYFRRFLDFLHQNEDLLAGLVSRSENSFMVQFSNTFARVLREHGAAENLQIPVEYGASLLAWSTAGLVEEWARGGFTDDRENVLRILVDVAAHIQGLVFGQPPASAD